MLRDRILGVALSVLMTIPYPFLLAQAPGNQGRLENFRSDTLRQRLSLLGSFSEFVDPAQEERLLDQEKSLIAIQEVMGSHRYRILICPRIQIVFILNRLPIRSSIPLKSPFSKR